MFTKIFNCNNLAFLLPSICLAVALTGCGDPPLHPITGKVTVDGKSYERLLIYMDPIDEEVNEFNKGVGETDVTGEFKINSTASTPEQSGLAAGDYRVYFNCWVRKGVATGLSNEKPDENDRRLETEDIVPFPYNDPTESPVIFTVKSGSDNRLEMDLTATGQQPPSE